MPNYIELISVIGYKIEEYIGIPLNSHQGYQLFYNITGSGEYLVGDKKYTLGAGESIIVPPFADHMLLSCLSPELVVLDIQFTVLNPVFDKKMRTISAVVHKKSHSSAPLMRLIISEARKRCGYFHATTRNLVETYLLMLIDISEGVSGTTKKSIQHELRELSECTVQTVKKLDGYFIGNHNLELDYLAKTLGYNKQYLCKCFREEIGMPIKSYLMMMRIEKAKELIDHTEYAIKDIAEILSFNSYAHFERMFKTYVGMAPGAYRKMSEQNKQYFDYSFREEGLYEEFD